MPDGSACHVLPGMATKLLNKLPRMRKSLTEAIATYHELLVATTAVAESMAAETYHPCLRYARETDSVLHA